MTKKEIEYYQIKWKEANQQARKLWAVYKEKPTKANQKLASQAYDKAGVCVWVIYGQM